MADAKPQPGQGSGDQDPSMEEILQSIRRIIAEDDKKGGAPADANGTALGSDVLELTEMVQDDGSTVSLGAADMAAQPAEASPLDVLASIDSALSEEVLSQEVPANPPPAEAAPAAPAPAAPAPAAPAAAATPENDLLSPAAAATAAAALKKVPPKAEAPAPATTPSMAFRSGTTVEDLVRESLRPMLKEWLDTNLPAIVERIVEREVKKLRDN